MSTRPRPNATASEGPPLETRALDHCLACGGTRLEPLRFHYEYRGTVFPAAECRECGMRFLRVQPVGQSLSSLYSEEYFDQDFRCGRVEARAFDEAAFESENAGLLDDFARLRPPGRLLEIGCAAGWLLKLANQRGWRSQGVELSDAAVAQARSLGLEVHHGDLANAGFPAGHFDLVYMGDVLEHVPDCRQTLDEVARVLAPGGQLYLRGPNTTHSLSRRLGLALFRLVGRDIVLREPPYHLWEFTPRSLRSLAQRAGLEVLEMRQSKISPGRSHGEKSGLQRLAMAAIDTVNLPLTRWLNVLGDRVVMVARKPGGTVVMN